MIFIENLEQLLKKEIKKYPVLPDEEQMLLAKQYKKSGDKKSFEKLFHHNLRLCLKVSYKYSGKLESMTFLDLFQECSIILMNAIKHYNPTGEAKFSTYAMSALEKTIKNRIFELDKTIRTPVYKEEQKTKYYQFITEYNQQYHKNPTKKEIKEKLGLNDDQLKNLEMNIGQKSISLDQKISSEEDSVELIELIPNKNNDYKDIESSYDMNILKNKCVQILTKEEYYIIYYRYISEERKTLDQIGKEFNLTIESIRQVEKKALEKLKRRIKSKKVNDKYNKNLDPLSIDTTILLNELKKYLSNEEYFILYSTIVQEMSTDISTEDHVHDLQILDLDKEKLLDIKKYLLEVFNHYKKEKNLECLRDNYHKNYTVAQIMELNINISSRDLMDFHLLEQYFRTVSIEEIKNTKYYENLSLKNQKLIQKYYDYNDRYLRKSEIKQIEQELTLEKFGYLETEKTLYDRKELQKIYLKNREILTQKEQEILGVILFRNNQSYSLKESTRQKYINRLIKIEFKIKDFYQNKITKKQIEQILEYHPNLLSQDEKELICKSYGVNQDKISLKELAKEYSVSYEELHDKVFTLKNRILCKYYQITEGKKDELPEDEKKLYQMYLSNVQYEFSVDTRRILGMFLSGKNYQEIATIEKISITKVSNFITEGLRKCEFYKYGIIVPFLIQEEEIDIVLQLHQYSEIKKKLIKERYLKLKMLTELSNEYHINKQDISKLKEKFYDQYLKWKCPQISINQYEEEIKRHQADSVLTEEEKSMVAFKYGIKCEYNPMGKKEKNQEIADHFSISLNCCKAKINSFNRKMRERILRLTMPKYGIIRRDEMRKILNNNPLLISEKERDIICHTNELNGYCYLSETELKEKYQERSNNFKRRYDRAVLSIKKYQDNLLPRKIDYQKDIKNIERYFSKYDRKLLEMIYNQRLTEKQIAEKLEITDFQSRQKIIKIKLDVAEILNDEPQAKMFDFDYARKVIDQEDLPLYYINNNLAKTIYQMITGENGQKKYTSKDVVKELNLIVPQKALDNCCYSVMIAIEKYKRGIRKVKTVTTEEIIDYYQHSKEKIPVEIKSYIEKKVFNNPLANQKTLPNKLIYEILKYRGEFSIDINQINHTTARELVRNKKLTSSCRKKIKGYFQIPEREIMNGKEKLKVLKLLSPLYKKREYQDEFKCLKKSKD
ncbi:MAG: sigma-70 family RNA polymerase sigma factor [Bacilli bacterium]|nr:sigma-70 family RNA polymerase sigma factor [Bacilli bacterium]